jgi:hypothetical protein
MGPFGDALGDLLGGQPGKPKPEKGVPLHAKEIAGVLYVRADDVAALLEINGLLPETVAKLRKRVQS